MPAIDIDFLKLIKDVNLLNNYTNFVETGTLVGDTIFEMEKYFENLYTVELSEYYYNIAKSKKEDTKINFLLGDSSKVFLNLLPEIKGNTIFFLDGHWSSGNTGKGDKDCPLIEEIEKINTLFNYKGIIIIDDVRLFGRGPSTGTCLENWEDISSDKLLKILNERITDSYYLPSKLYEKDRLIIHIKEKV